MGLWNQSLGFLAHTFWYNIEANVAGSFSYYNNGLNFSAGAWIEMADTAFWYFLNTSTGSFVAFDATVAWFSVTNIARINFFAHAERNWIATFSALLTGLDGWASAAGSFVCTFFADPRFGWFARNNDFNFFNTNTLRFEADLA